MKELQELGKAVAALRKRSGMTQKELAAATGLAQSTLARFETGRVAEFGAQKLLRLLEAVGHEMEFVAGKRAFTLDDALEQRLAQAENAGARGGAGEAAS